MEAEDAAARIVNADAAGRAAVRRWAWLAQARGAPTPELERLRARLGIGDAVYLDALRLAAPRGARERALGALYAARAPCALLAGAALAALLLW